ncbi:MAG: hypothetical protein AB1427_00950 [Thermodesulfobacteriota bacterium]
MAQNFTDDCFAAGHVGATDLQNMENNFASLKSMFSGAAAPSNPVAGMLWFDTTKKVLKQRNVANSAWIGLMHGDLSQKGWVYRNAAMDGWAVDSTVTDRVLALKGGTGLYNVSGGTVAGETWANLKAHTHPGPSHAHGLGTMAAQNHVHTLASGSNFDVGTANKHVAIKNGALTTNGGGNEDQKPQASATTGNPSATALTGAMANSGTGNTGAQSTADVRPAAAVGTLQYLDL